MTLCRHATSFSGNRSVRTYPIKPADVEPPLSRVTVPARHRAIAMERNLLRSSLPWTRMYLPTSDKTARREPHGKIEQALALGIR